MTWGLTEPKWSGLRSGMKTSGYTFFKYQEKLLHCSRSRRSMRRPTSPKALCGNNSRQQPLKRGGETFLITHTAQALDWEEKLHYHFPTVGLVLELRG